MTVVGVWSNIFTLILGILEGTGMKEAKAKIRVWY